jgi:hypothetical protein
MGRPVRLSVGVRDGGGICSVVKFLLTAVAGDGSNDK